MKQMSALRAELNKTDSLLGQKKSSTRKASAVQTINNPDLLTEQMLADRWHCSASRLRVAKETSKNRNR
jgi:hypothetical protein